jgi:hypothetical protein
MKGHQELIRMRTEGARIRSLWIYHGKDPSKQWSHWDKTMQTLDYPDVEIQQHEDPRMLDLRYVIGMTVHVFGCHDYKKSVKLHEALVNAKAKQVITNVDEIIIDSVTGEWGGYVPE